MHAPSSALLAAFSNATTPNPTWTVKGPTLWLSLPFIALTLICGVQLLRLWARRALFGFQFWFLSLCFVWTLIRGLWFATYPLLGVADVLLFWLPYYLQFATFSFLVVFYATIDRNERHHTSSSSGAHLRYTLIVYGVVNLVIGVPMLTSVVVDMSEQHDTHVADTFADAVSIIVSGMYVLLACALFFYGYRIASLLSNRPTFVVPFHPRWMRSHHLIGVALITFCIFLSRAVYDTVSVWVTLFEIYYSSRKPATIVIVVLLTTLWDVLPAVVVVWLFFDVRGDTTTAGSDVAYAPISSPGRDRGARRRFGGGIDVRPGGVFESDKRYDSDEEAGQPSSYGAVGSGGEFSGFAYSGAHSPHGYIGSINPDTVTRN